MLLLPRSSEKIGVKIQFKTLTLALPAREFCLQSTCLYVFEPFFFTFPISNSRKELCKYNHAQKPPEWRTIRFWGSLSEILSGFFACAGFYFSRMRRGHNFKRHFFVNASYLCRETCLNLECHLTKLELI